MLSCSPMPFLIFFCLLHCSPLFFFESQICFLVVNEQSGGQQLERTTVAGESTPDDCEQPMLPLEIISSIKQGERQYHQQARLPFKQSNSRIPTHPHPHLTWTPSLPSLNCCPSKTPPPTLLPTKRLAVAAAPALTVLPSLRMRHPSMRRLAEAQELAHTALSLELLTRPAVLHFITSVGCDVVFAWYDLIDLDLS
jgi:hypothetical protein